MTCCPMRRESSVLIAATSAGVPAALRGHIAEGMAPVTAIRLAAASMETRTAYPSATCEWVAREYAIALGIEIADADSSGRLLGAQPPTELAAMEAASSTPAGTRPQTDPQPGAAAPAAARRRGSRMALAALAVAVAAAAVAGYALARHAPAGKPVATATGSARHRGAQASPVRVVEAYIAAVNQKDWPKAWALGGKNLGQSYSQLVAGYAQTISVQITSITASGGSVTVYADATEANGVVQQYRLSYLVSGGVIIAGQSQLLTAG